ncbi:recombinase family protein [Arthrobacter sp. CJ23]|nr:recombinase family protein [Arthrobacter sp. CJ23]UVJ41569.1 recombinase family protein [Arthrobacter sp. CJ23]
MVFHVFAALAEFIRDLVVAGTREGLAAAGPRPRRRLAQRCHARHHPRCQGHADQPQGQHHLDRQAVAYHSRNPLQPHPRRERSPDEPAPRACPHRWSRFWAFPRADWS